MSIYWGKQQRFKFATKSNLMDWSPPSLPAICAITYKPDPTNKPKSHNVVFFGGADDMAQHASSFKSTVLDLWAETGGDVNDLYVFLHAMPDSTTVERNAVENQLVSEYHPKCNQYV